MMSPRTKCTCTCKPETPVTEASFLQVTHVLLDPGTDWHRAPVHVTALSMGNAEQDKLLADGALVPFPRHHQLALPGVGEDSLHLDTAGLLAVYVLALCGMDQEPYAFLYEGLTLFLPTGLVLRLGAIQLQTSISI